MSISLDVNNHATEHLDEETRTSTSISANPADEESIRELLEQMKEQGEVKVDNYKQQELVEIGSLFSKMKS